MILRSFDHAEEDFRLRQIAEARVEADHILNALEKGSATRRGNASATKSGIKFSSWKGTDCTRHG